METPTGTTSNTPNGRFDYVRYDGSAQVKQDEFKSAFKTLEGMTTSMLPPGRAQSLVLTKLEEAYMWVGKSIRDEQVQNRASELQEGRCNS